MVCGLGSYCSPRWLQPLASKQMFLAIFCLACVLQGMFYTYFVSVLTTIEKLFQIQSKTTGIISQFPFRSFPPSPPHPCYLKKRKIPIIPTARKLKEKERSCLSFFARPRRLELALVLEALQDSL